LKVKVVEIKMMMDVEIMIAMMAVGMIVVVEKNVE
jgi:hypothetical protein